MRDHKIVLCRWDVADLFEPKKFCGKAISKTARLDYCDEHLARLPFWPTAEKSDYPDKKDP